MRQAAAVALAACVFLLAGCADEAEPVTDLEDDAPAEEQNVTVPDPLQYSGSMRRLMVPVLQESFCQSTCEISYPFEVEDNLTVEIVLVSRQGVVSDPTGTSGVEADYDLLLVDGSGAVLGESNEYGTTPDRIVATISPGKYSAEVYTYQDPDGGYDLTISFAA